MLYIIVVNRKGARDREAAPRDAELGSASIRDEPESFSAASLSAIDD